MRFSLEIELDNDFTYGDLRELLNTAINRVDIFDAGDDASPLEDDGNRLHDANGNTVGKWKVTEDRKHTVRRSDGQTVSVVIPERD